MTFYLGLYFGLGIIALLVLFLLGSLKKREDDGGLVFAYTVKESWWEKTLIPVAGYSFMLLIWPTLVLWKIKEELYPEKTSTDLEHEEFSVKQEHLLQQMTVEEIEHAAMVSDPLGAVPNLPFGHLNFAWQQFKENFGSEKALWKFAAYTTNEWGDKEYREGYVILHKEDNNPYFLTKFVNKL